MYMANFDSVNLSFHFVQDIIIIPRLTNPFFFVTQFTKGDSPSVKMKPPRYM